MSMPASHEHRHRAHATLEHVAIRNKMLLLYPLDHATQFNDADAVAPVDVEDRKKRSR